MPATEKTWRDQTRMHVVFGASGVILLIATIWMFAKDHNREWKRYQTTARQVDKQFTEWRKVQFQTEEIVSQHDSLETRLSEIRAEGLDPALLKQFRTEVIEAAERRGNSSPNFDKFSVLEEEVEQTAKAVRDAKQQETAAQLEFDAARTNLKEAREALTAAKAKATEAAAAKEKSPAAEEAAKQAVDEAATAIKDLEQKVQQAAQELRDKSKARRQAEAKAGKPRGKLVQILKDYLQDAKDVEAIQLGKRKFVSANLDKAKADVGLGIRDGRSDEAIDALQAEVDRLMDKLTDSTLRYQAEMLYRESLQKLYNELTGREAAMQKQIADSKADLKRLNTALAQQKTQYFEGWWFGKKWLMFPIIDAFNSPLKIDNLWSDGLEQDLNFRKVRRFDRCTTCHQSMEKTMPGSAVDPAYDSERLIQVTLSLRPAEEASGGSGSGADPAAADSGEKPGDKSTKKKLTVEQELERQLGMQLADHGLLRRDDVTVRFVRPQSPAAGAVPKISETLQEKEPGEELLSGMLQPKPWEQQQEGLIDADRKDGLLVGDVIVAINGDQVSNKRRAVARLLDGAKDPGMPLVLTVRRGLPHPYTSHPKLDLYIGSMSPHKLADFACTICHDGQGSATDFKWASHTPNSMSQRRDWRRDHGWFDNHHWIYPMQPARFVESVCLKCHHDTSELEPSERFPEGGAPKLLQGRDLVTSYGCFGCHEINGYDGPDKTVGPDLRLEPNVFAAAQQLKNDPNFASLGQEAAELVSELIEHPERDAARRRLYTILEQDRLKQSKLDPEIHGKISPLLKDLESPGSLRKVGPSLRFVDHKLNPDFTYDWIWDPQNARPSTKMPRFFGHWDHLDETSRHVSEKYEPIEVFGMAEYLRLRSQPFEYLTPPEGISDTSKVDAVARGKGLFQTRGCLACHSHPDFPDAPKYRAPGTIQQGPDLTGLAGKFSGEKGRKWMYSWVKQPQNYHVRTKMPDMKLDPIEHRDDMGKVTMITDPAADIVEYLLSSEATWKPQPGNITDLSASQQQDLDSLVSEYLRDAFATVVANDYLKNGIPQRLQGGLKGAERELLVPDQQYDSSRAARDAVSGLPQKQKLLYVGSKTISKYGCYGCHDIPGFEAAKSIGTGLADWGRKDPSKLAFEHILEYLELGHGHGAGGNGHAQNGHDKNGDKKGHDEKSQEGDQSDSMAAGGDDHGHSHGPQQVPPDYFMEQLHSHNRTGFLYQKLAEPRSYDYHKTLNKKYNERLRMPLFRFDMAEREAVMTFVLGLVADPPTAKYVYKPDERSKAIQEGKRVLAKYNCSGCHILKPEQWTVAFDPGHFEPQQVKPTYPFSLADSSPEQLRLSAVPERTGRLTAVLSGMPTIDNNGRVLVNDSEGDPVEPDYTYNPTKLEYSFTLWEPATIGGRTYQVGELPLNIKATLIRSRDAVHGGDVTRYLMPHVVAAEKQKNPNAKGAEAWAWLPPPLIGQGRKVQSDWLHDFLLDPHTIRPATVMRMPRFNMSSAEASALVNYFAAMDNVDFPYSYTARRRSDHLNAAEQDYAKAAPNGQQSMGRLESAMQIVTDNNYCIKCHLVGDFVPSGRDIAKAPDLSVVYQRLRPDYVRSWIGRPAGILPYTSMPVNIPYTPDAPNLGGVPQKLYHGTSVQQLDGLVDLLMNYDRYAKSRAKIAPLIKPAAPADQPAVKTGASLRPQSVPTKQSSAARRSGQPGSSSSELQVE